jgi:hypothetical protein
MKFLFSILLLVGLTACEPSKEELQTYKQVSQRKQDNMSYTNGWRRVADGVDLWYIVDTERGYVCYRASLYHDIAPLECKPLTQGR